MKDNGWSPNLIKRMKVIKSRCWSYTWIHRENAIFLNDIYDWISVIAYGLSFFNGAILMFPNNVIYVRILSVLLSFGSGILIFYMKNKRLTETAEKHKIASSKFSNIYNSIARQLSLDFADRKPGLVYHEWITQVYDTLFGSAPDIDPPVMEEYVRKFARKRRVNPIEAAEFDASDDNSEFSSTSDTGYDSFVNEIVVVDKKGGETIKKEHSSSIGGAHYSNTQHIYHNVDEVPTGREIKESSKSSSDDNNDAVDNNDGADNNDESGRQKKFGSKGMGSVSDDDSEDDSPFIEETGDKLGGETGLVILGNQETADQINELSNLAKELKKERSEFIENNKKKFLNYELERMGIGMSDLLATPRCSIPEYELLEPENDRIEKRKKKKKK